MPPFLCLSETLLALFDSGVKYHHIADILKGKSYEI